MIWKRGQKWYAKQNIRDDDIVRYGLIVGMWLVILILFIAYIRG